MPENNHDPADASPIDPLTIGDLLTLKEAAEQLNLNYNSLRKYAVNGRLKAKQSGSIWLTTVAAILEYQQSRHRGERTDLIKKKNNSSK